MRRLAIAAVLLLSFAPVAAADGAGPPDGALLSGSGIVVNGLRYVALPADTLVSGPSTFVAAVRTSDGAVARSTAVDGQYGFPRVGLQGALEGLSADRSTLVLAETPFAGQNGGSNSFAVFDAHRLRLVQRIDLKGDFAYDALSPHGATLFLIQHVSAQNLSRYIVRAYDLRRRTLLPQRIADRTQRGWVMSGYPVDRATSRGGRWVYTLYQNPGGYPFVHALDTVGRKAHCVGIPWRGVDQSALWKLKLSLADRGRKLDLRWRSGRSYLAIDTRSFRISHAQSRRGSGAAALPLAGAAAAAFLLLGGALVRARRR
jgi:hypothetical protein